MKIGFFLVFLFEPWLLLGAFFVAIAGDNVLTNNETTAHKSSKK